MPPFSGSVAVCSSETWVSFYKSTRPRCLLLIIVLGSLGEQNYRLGEKRTMSRKLTVCFCADACHCMKLCSFNPFSVIKTFFWSTV
jgi:hypothetical protein